MSRVVETFKNVPLQEVAIRAFLGDPGRVLDVGPGIRPTCKRWLKSPAGWVGLEAFDTYVDFVRRKWPELDVVHHVCPPIPFDANTFDTVVLDDVIEHLEKSNGQDLFGEAMRVARRGVLVRTPNGFVRQDFDPWLMDGDYWQKHRSGWTPDDFPTATHVWHETGHSKGPWMGLWIPKEESCDTSSPAAPE